MRHMKREHLILLIETMAEAANRSPHTVSYWVSGSGDLYRRLKLGCDITTRRAERITQRASDRWPADTPWPSDIPRPRALVSGFRPTGGGVMAIVMTKRGPSVSAIRYEAGVDVWGSLREPAERQAVRRVIMPFVVAEVARGLDADGIARSLVLAGLEVTDWDRAFIRHALALDADRKAA